MWQQLEQQIGTALGRLMEALLSVIPAALVLLASVVIGILAGLFLRVLLSLLFRVFLRPKSTGPSTVGSFLRAAGLPEESRNVVGLVSFWAAVVVSLVVGVNALEPSALKSVLSDIVAFLPRLLTSALLFLLGLGVAALARRSVLLGAVNAGLPWARAGARGVHLVVLTFFVAAALDNLRVARSILVASFSIGAGGLALAFALAFGLGARDLARGYLEKKMRAEQEDTGIRHV